MADERKGRARYGAKLDGGNVVKDPVNIAIADKVAPKNAMRCPEIRPAQRPG